MSRISRAGLPPAYIHLGLYLSGSIDETPSPYPHPTCEPPVRNIGIATMLLGLVGLVLSAVTISRPREVARVGTVSLTVQEEQRPLVPRPVGVGVLVVGLGLVVAGRRGRA